MGAQALYVRGFQRGYKNGDEATRINEGGASDVKAKDAARKNVLAKAKTITGKKLEIPEDATYNLPATSTNEDAAVPAPADIDAL